MNACNFEYLWQFVKKQLDLDKQLEVYDHLDQCDICRDAVYQISRDLDGVLFIDCAHCVKSYAVRRHIDAAASGHAQINANALARQTVKRSSNRRL